jgi:hypothetical protein
MYLTKGEGMQHLKKITLVALLFISTIVFAGQYQVYYLNESTRIVLSKVACDEDRGFRAAVQNTNHQFVKGCWVVSPENMIHITWKDGDFSVFSPDMFSEVMEAEI